MSTLIIAEKPSVAQSIASALGANKRNDGYFEGNGYFISFAFGHLYTLADTQDYNPAMAKWSLEYFPFIPDPFIYKPHDDEGAKKQIDVLRSLVEKSNMVINACDGDREGELIFAEIRNDLNIQLPIKRLWLTSYTPKDVEKGIANLKEDMINLVHAGYCRQKVDWIIGINLTSVYSLKAGGNITLRVGRVVLPTLNLIFEREAEISNFKSVPFYTLKAQFTSKNASDDYWGTYYDPEGVFKFTSKEDLLKIHNEIQNKSGQVAKKESKQSIENSPKLFSLTDLQGHITSKFNGFSSDLVLSVTQRLYEKKYVTYPRTASQYLDDSQMDDAKDSLKAVMALQELNLKDTDPINFHTEKRVFDSSKVDSHPAIIPTYITPNLSSLSEDEKIVYLEIVKRFIAQFMPSAIYDNLEIVTMVEAHQFITRGKVLVQPGWKNLYLDIDQEEEDGEESDKITAMNIVEGDFMTVSKTTMKDSKTKPPAHYTEKTLLMAMQNCGKNVENEEDVLKGFTIGTPATRAETIKKLRDSGYIYDKGKNLLLTELGAKVIHYFPVKRLLKVDFTGQIEKTLKDIEQGTYDPNVFMEKMSSFVSKNIEDMKNSEIPTIERPVVLIGKCPDCGGRVVETELAYSCENTRSKTCKFTLWKNDKFFKHFGKKLTLTIATEFVNNRQANVKGLKNPKKENAKFDTVIKIEKDLETGYWGYKMDFSQKTGKSKSKTKTPIKFK